MLTVLRIAAADLWHDRRLGLCTVLSLAAVLAPLLVLGGLRAGVVDGLRELLLQDPAIRQVISATNRTIAPEVLDSLAARPDVAFLVPRTRTLAASLLLQAADGRQSQAELIPSAGGDPLLPGGAPGAPDRVVLSAAAAARLGVAPGAPLTGRLARISPGGGRELVMLPLTVQAVAPPHAFPREAAFVTLPLARFVEDYQDGRVDAPRQEGGIAALPEAARPGYAGFRLYARRLEDVPGLDAALRAEGLDIVSRAGDVAGLLSLDANLRLLLWIVAGLGGTGYLISLGSGLWAGVERRRPSFAVLRFLGMPGGGLVCLPALQSLALSATGAALAVAAASASAAGLNRAFAGTLGLDRPLCTITWAVAGVGVALTLAGGCVAAIAAGLRVGRVEPWESLR
jgi:putative ABC transport system permease protein